MDPPVSCSKPTRAACAAASAACAVTRFGPSSKATDGAANIAPSACRIAVPSVSTLCVSIVHVVTPLLAAVVHAASAALGASCSRVRRCILAVPVMVVVKITRMHRFDDAANQGQASEGQQDQTHGFFLGYSVVDGATVLTTVGVDAGVTTVTAGAGGVTGEADASAIAPGRARSIAA